MNELGGFKPLALSLGSALKLLCLQSSVDMSSNIPSLDDLDAKTQKFYTKALKTLKGAGIPFLVGGAYGFEHYTGIARHTKDLDIFVRPGDRDRVFEAFAATGWRTELSLAYWLGKVFLEEDFIDIIFNSPNANDQVDEIWFEHAVEAEVFGIPVKLCSPEEMIRSKAFIMERHRWDGADVAHLFRACADQLNWSYLLERFGSHWRILLTHLILFGFIYPSERERIPAWVMQDLLHRLHKEMITTPPSEPLCQGTLLSGSQYLIDVECWGYQDARLRPQGSMTAAEIAQWTAAIKKNK